MIRVITVYVGVNKMAGVRIQDYDEMVSLVEEMDQASQGSLTSSVSVQYLYSFALNRCCSSLHFYVYISILCCMVWRWCR